MCETCTTFVGDIQTMAIEDPLHYRRLYRNIVKDACSTLDGVMETLCKLGLEKLEKESEESINDLTPTEACEIALMCEPDHKLRFFRTKL